MALVLAMQEGRAFYVDNTRVEVMHVGAPGTVKVKVFGAIDRILTLSDKERIELMPDVYAQMGLGSTSSMIKVVLEAPRNRKILRDTLWEQDKAAS